MAVIGCVVLDSDRVLDMAEKHFKIDHSAFYMPRTGMAFKAAVEMHAAGKPIDLLTIGDWISKSDGAYSDWDKFLQDAMDAAPTSVHAGYYLEMVRNRWLLRQVITGARRLVEEGFEKSGDGEKLLKSAPETFYDLAESVFEVRSNADICLSNVESFRQAKEKGAPICDASTPWQKLNEIIIGLEKGITIAAGRPSEGKTIVEDMIAEYNAFAGIPVLRICLDMNKTDLLMRMQGRMAGVSISKAKAGFAKQNQLAALENAGKEIGKLPMWVMGLEDGMTSLGRICSTVRSFKRRYGIKLVTLDYLQLVNTGDSKVDQHEYSRVTAVSGGLKNLLGELELPGLILCQLSRPEDKKEKPPTLRDLRGSGYIEQDASKVIMVYRAYNVPDNDKVRASWFDVQKHQNGKLGAIPVVMLKRYFRFETVNDWWDEYDKNNQPNLDAYMNRGCHGEDGDGKPGQVDEQELIHEFHGHT